LVLDKDGKKQSKSRGNGIDPKDMIDKYGRDALRLSLVSSVAPDQDFRLFEEKIKGYRNFINKVYNSSRLIFMMLEKNKNSLPSIKKAYGTYSTKTSINISREMTDHVKKIDVFFRHYEIGLAAFELQNFYHHIFCDIYLEAIKPYQDKPKALGEILYVFYQNILLLHPFIPFITEHIFQDLKRLGYIDTENETMDYEIYPKL
jgi:valyl-tRNA synthetase